MCKNKKHGLWATALLISALFVLLSAVTPAFSAANNTASTTAVPGLQQSLQQLKHHVAAALVRIEVKQDRSALFFQPFADIVNDPFMRHFMALDRHLFRGYNFGTRNVSGSGFLVSKDGYILTSNQLVNATTAIEVRLNDNTTHPATVVGVARDSALALLKIDTKELPYLPFADSDKVQRNDVAIACGIAEDNQPLLTLGTIYSAGKNGDNVIRTDANINPYNIGGPLLNGEGKVIGVNVASGEYGVNLAIPINRARHIEKQLLQCNRTTGVQLGVHVQQVTEALAPSFQLDKAVGVLVNEVVPASAADKAGLKQGDVILQVGSVTTDNIDQFNHAVAALPTRSKVELSIVREGKKQQLTAVVPEKKTAKPHSGFNSWLGNQPLPYFGLTLVKLRDKTAKKLGYTEDHGVLVAAVADGSMAQWAGIRPNSLITEIDHQKVKDLAQAQKLLTSDNNGQPHLLLLKYGDAVQYVAMQFSSSSSTQSGSAK